MDLGKESYKIEIERGLLPHIGEKIRKLTKAQKIAVITDNHVQAIYGDKIRESLQQGDFHVRIIEMPAGEENKNIHVLEGVYNELCDFNLSRDDAIVTFSGGVPGDLGGFAAASYMRGVPFFQVPTTILAQIDSSVGGKVAIDLPGGKNLAGAFYQPKGVFIDPDLLDTLPTRYVHDGLAEALKYGCIGDPELFELLENIGSEEDLRNHMEEIILRSVLQKKKFVEEDRYDNGSRQMLNFGHTIGHAIERYFNYSTYTHGEGVAIGMCLLTEQTERLGITEEEIRRARPHIDSVAYSHYMLCEAQAGDVLTGLVTLLNCSWSYAYIAEQMVERCPSALHDENYGAWFAGYVSEEYRQTNQALIDRIDALAEVIDEKKAQRLCEIFGNCCLFDLRFWDMVYTMGEN